MSDTMAETHSSPPQPHVHVRVGACDIAIPIAHVKQALPQQGLTVLPRRTGALLGVVDVAGASVPIVALDRWLPIDASDDVAQQRLLVLQQGGALVGLQVDAVLGVRAVDPGAIRRVHHASDDNELFESVVSATADQPTLCILEVERLMQLSQAWCADAELGLADVSKDPRAVAEKTSITQRYAVFQIGAELWAVAVETVQRVMQVPAVELSLGHKDLCWAISQVRGRKLPLVDVSAGHQASSPQDAPWMVILNHGPLILGLTVTACKQFVDLGKDSIARIPGDMLLTGVAVLPELGKLQILDTAKLFNEVSLAAISQYEKTSSPSGEASDPVEALDPSPYLVFEAGQRYASPVTGIVGLMELPQQVRDDLRNGKSAALAWRGKTINMVTLPSLSTTADFFDPTMAVLVQPPDEKLPPVGIAIKRLSDWLPAHSAARRGMRMNAMGEFCMINAPGNAAITSVVVVDLAQMAFLLG